MNIQTSNNSLLVQCDFIIIGGGGDLSLRKIMPALFWIFLDNQINKESRIIICLRQKSNLEEFSSKLLPYCKQAIENQTIKKKIGLNLKV